jgi:hypothetical protein
VTEPPPAVPRADPFNGSRFIFSTDVRAGQVAPIRDDAGHVRLTYRSFASVVGVVALFVAAIVFFAGAAATLFLLAEGRPAAAAAAAILSLAFSGMIAGMVPPVRVTLYDGTKPALSIVQRSRFAFPFATYAVTTADGSTLALIRSGVMSRLGRCRWVLRGTTDGYAVEESFGRALVRKMLGKFDRRYQSNVRLVHENREEGEIVRRPDDDGQFDYIELARGATLDRRVAVALATLVFGSEP